jgi:predicted methyltransferase
MKSVAVYNLKLPKDVIDIICSFNFYTLSECIEITKQNRTNVVKELKYVERFQYYGYQPYHKGIYHHIQINMITINDEFDMYKEMNICICIFCNKFVQNIPDTNALCNC